MRLLFCGDVVGQPGRRVLFGQLPRLKRELELDFVIANGENAAGGFGITPAICEDFYQAGVDVITSGNHVWDQREIIPHLAREVRLLRPLNYPPGTAGAGAGVFAGPRGGKVLVINVMMRLFMDPLDDPYRCVDEVLAGHELGADTAAIVVDVHGEASSEKQAMGRYLDGRVSMVIGTHTHVPTSDTMIFPAGTAYQTDAGMCGDYDSVIGGDKEMWVSRFHSRLPTGRVQPAKGEGTLCAVYAELDPATGLARRAAPVILGPWLEERWPI
ncbi:MAG: TIGR00282 family metallophosphoesterase [Alphaproteobacteria bacterium]|jgi:hypothetical protein|nr:TIGR00282 family metallophosphoesterase [Alphaproteobacteria bacterium]MDP6515940.1 TIGR00282 family metallophosphoesterase [Alphaproteobacteria bacterium]